MIRSTPLLLLFALSSCFLLKDLKRERFTYNVGEQALTLHLKVPRGFVREKEEIDSAGNTALFFHYPNGMVLYSAHLVDTARQYQYIDYARNLALPHPLGGWIFKGMDSTERYWREIRVGPYKFGYFNVPRSVEGAFDEALNFNSLQTAKVSRKP